MESTSIRFRQGQRPRQPETDLLQEGQTVPFKHVARDHEIRGAEYVVLTQEGIDAARRRALTHA